MDHHTVICTDLDGKQYHVSPDDMRWRPSVYGIIIEDDKILLSPCFGDGYDLPGGGMELHETVEQALKREVWEETGFEALVGELVSVCSSFFMPRSQYSSSKQPANAILLYYVCHITGGKLSTEHFDEDEQKHTAEATWIPISQIDNIKFYSTNDVQSVIRKAEVMINQKTTL